MVKTQEVYLSLGSNLGDRMFYLLQGLRGLQEYAGDIVRCSSVYETTPVGFEAQQMFLNVCALVETHLEPLNLLSVCQLIEQSNGRKRSLKNGYESRTLDIDILYIGQHVINNPKLCIPHPRIGERKFVLIPLLEIAPEIIDPKSCSFVREKLSNCTSDEKLDVFAKKVNFNI
jgi:2-amino-4-hydroxy-6-hydroxymethyldihydropteridine diphosphokinase